MCLFTRQDENQGQTCQEAAGQRLVSPSRHNSAGISSLLREKYTQAEAGWISFHGCCRNYLCIGLEEMMSKVASNSRLLMLYTSTSAQGESSPALWSLKSPVPLPVPQDPKREHRRSQGEWNQRFHCSAFTMYWTVCCKAQWEQRALDSVRRPEFDLASANF